MSCHYGCQFRGCQGYSKAEVVEFLEGKGEPVTMDTAIPVLNSKLMDYFDVDFNGPDHVNVAESDHP